LVLLLFVFKVGIFAVIVCYMLFSLVIAILNIIAIKRLTGYKLDPRFSILMPVIVSAVVVVVCLAVAFLFSRFLSGRVMNLLIVLVSLILGAGVYLAGILFTGCLTKAQVLELPFGSKLARLFTKLRLFRE
ncbi:MAG: polysaccharide biosynthesis C-terminal domain-containing protein, partial [Lachnospiraceae bacterium]|nr:polysaccharide biosynthesis C-terminal domain-containing protein [Lachnospiraceae bacterium]